MWEKKSLELTKSRSLRGFALEQAALLLFIAMRCS
jgi:hypothetical protein